MTAVLRPHQVRLLAQIDAAIAAPEQTLPPRNVIRSARIERARDCDGWYVIRGSHGWLFGDRRGAVVELDELTAIEQGPQARALCWRSK
jgi:hypothetical protein